MPTSGQTSPRMFGSQRRAYAGDAVLGGKKGELRHEWERAREGGVVRVRSLSIATAAVGATAADQGLNSDEVGGDGSSIRLLHEHQHDDESHKLDEFRATSIAGNDITSSCLYSAGITLSAAGVWAPLSSCLLIFVLFLFRNVYSEVCSALPMNGGTYNALLNTTSKMAAALAAVLSMVSYTATAVTSAASAGEYLHYQWDFLPAMWIAIGILIFFACLNLVGISESANSAAFLFALHMLTMATLIVASVVYVIRDGGETLKSSFRSSSQEANPHGTVAANIWHGYCAALLGITGFESSANYIEEQRRGVFPKTLRNMWIAVSFLNPVLVFLCMGVINIVGIVNDSDYSLAAVAEKAGGPWLRYVVVIDAMLVLSGAVLTSYVGISGLLRRMAFDQLMPSFFVQVNPCRKTNHWIIFTFCLLTCSLRLAVHNMNTLGGVYAIAFLGVMSLCAIANLALKFKRAGLKRAPITPVPVVVLALLTVFAGMIGNMLRSDQNALWFLIYFVAFASLVIASIFRIPFLRMVVSMTQRFFPNFATRVRGLIADIRSQRVMFFTKTCSAARLNKVVQYVLDNEDTTNILVAYCTQQYHRPEMSSIDDAPAADLYEGDDDSAPVAVQHKKPPAEQQPPVHEPTPVAAGSSEVRASVHPAEAMMDEALPQEEFLRLLEEACVILDRLYPKITVELIIVDAPFCPNTLTRLSEETGVPKNYMFITCPTDSFPHDISRFGGLRVISY